MGSRMTTDGGASGDHVHLETDNPQLCNSLLEQMGAGHLSFTSQASPLQPHK
jgi:hypothetical protein